MCRNGEAWRPAFQTPAYLGDGDPTLLGKLLLCLLAGVGVGEVRVEIFIQDFRGLLAEVTPLAPG